MSGKRNTIDTLIPLKTIEMNLCNGKGLPVKPADFRIIDI